MCRITTCSFSITKVTFSFSFLFRKNKNSCVTCCVTTISQVTPYSRRLCRYYFTEEQIQSRYLLNSHVDCWLHVPKQQLELMTTYIQEGCSSWIRFHCLCSTLWKHTIQINKATCQYVPINFIERHVTVCSRFYLMLDSIFICSSPDNLEWFQDPAAHLLPQSSRLKINRKLWPPL